MKLKPCPFCGCPAEFHLDQESAIHCSECPGMMKDISISDDALVQAWNTRADHHWRPIDTAPKTSKAILVWCPENKCVFIVSWNGARWSHFAGNGSMLYEKPTLWMPVPVPDERGEHQ